MKRFLPFFAVICLGTLAFAQSTPAISQLFAFFCNRDFSSCPNGMEPTRPLLQLSDGNFYGVTWWAGQGTSNAGGAVFKITPAGQVTVVHTFQPGRKGNFPKGENPVLGFAEGPDGFLYGATESGGAHAAGVMYKVSRSGSGFKVLHNFCSLSGCPDGPGPLLLAKDGNFYGVVNFTIFKITPAGAWSLLHAMDPNTEGVGLSLIQASDGNFYGVGLLYPERGTVFRVTPAGDFTLLQEFAQFGRITSNLIQASDGNFYGATSGTIFQMTPSGSLQTIHNMTDAEGFSPVQLLQASDGNFWGLSGFRNGSIFAIDFSGNSLQSAAFDCAADGCFPQGMLQAKDGRFYGTAISGGHAPGQNPLGTVFKVDAGLPPPVH